MWKGKTNPWNDNFLGYFSFDLKMTNFWKNSTFGRVWFWTFLICFKNDKFLKKLDLLTVIAFDFFWFRISQNGRTWFGIPQNDRTLGDFWFGISQNGKTFGRLFDLESLKMTGLDLESLKTTWLWGTFGLESLKMVRLLGDFLIWNLSKWQDLIWNPSKRHDFGGLLVWNLSKW